MFYREIYMGYQISEHLCIVRIHATKRKRRLTAVDTSDAGVDLQIPLLALNRQVPNCPNVHNLIEVDEYSRLAYINGFSGRSAAGVFEDYRKVQADPASAVCKTTRYGSVTNTPLHHHRHIRRLGSLAVIILAGAAVSL
jgi:hypothetical protein